MLRPGDRVGEAMWSNTGGGRSASRGAGGRFGQRSTRPNGRRGYAGLAVIVAILVLAACYSAIEVATTGRPDPTPARQIVGAAHVLDGDTIDIAGERIRLHAIDTAEDGQRCGLADGGTWDCAEAATGRLRALTAGRTVTCDAVDRDRYGRTVAVCRVGDIDVQEVLTREGLAWAYRQYSRAYVSAEEAARAERRGIWQGPAQPPWEWRRDQQTRVATASSGAAPEGCRIKGNINSQGVKIYHTPASPWYDQTTVNESRGQRWFCSEAEAKAAGWRSARW
jgi:endonuclease YncB( thermonuclease family)